MKKSSLLLAVLMAASVTLGACAKKETTYTRAELVDAMAAQLKELNPEQPFTDEMRKKMDAALAESMVIADAASAAKFGDNEQIKKIMKIEQINSLAEVYLMNQFSSYKPTDAQVQAFYDDSVKQESMRQALSGKSMHLRHILVETEAQAIEIIGKLKAGEKFETLASVSKDPRGAPGGDLGWAPLATYVHAFADAASKLKAKEVTQIPVKTEFGYHVIEALEPMKTEKVANSPAQTLKPLDAVKPQVIQALKNKHLIELKAGYKKTADESAAKEATAAVKK